MLDSFSGFLLVIIAGVCWIGVGISVSRCSERGWNYDIIQGFSYLGATLLCALILVSSPRSGGPVFGWGFWLSFLAGITNFYTYVFTSKAMRLGPNGLVWGIMQAGMIGSFLMGMIFFGEKAALLRIIGLVLILGGIMLMGMSKDSKTPEKGKNWLLPALAAFLLVMLTHCCNALPSYLSASETDSIVRTMGLYFGGFIGFTLTTLPGMIRRRDFGGQAEWINAVILMVLNTSASLFFFYQGLDLLARNGCGGLGYPIATGVCVVGFSLYSLLFLKEKIARLSLTGLIAVCLGIITISLR
ncbi:MAG: EamA family transporter [Lentisphaeria bacterium]|nr:EamA family transporter [Lentisphaeria bacterium]